MNQQTFIHSATNSVVKKPLVGQTIRFVKQLNFWISKPSSPGVRLNVLFTEVSPFLKAVSNIRRWHFVDVVWIFVFVLVYYWGSRGSAPELDTADLSLLISAGPLLPSTGLSLLRSPGGSRFSLSFGFESYSAVYGSDEAVVHSEFCPFVYLWVEVPEKGCVDPQTGIQLRCLSRAPVSKELARRLGLNLQHTSVNPC